MNKTIQMLLSKIYNQANKFTSFDFAKKPHLPSTKHWQRMMLFLLALTLQIQNWARINEGSPAYMNNVGHTN